MWPTGGQSDTGFETFGTPVTTPPKTYTLPEVARGYYYDPVRLYGVGPVQPSVVHEFHGGTVVVRAKPTAIEAEFTAPYVWSDGLLDQFAFELSEPCAIVLDIYDDDRETVRWSFGTSPTHPRPYLCHPERYAAQDIDAATGAATIGTAAVTLIDRPRVAGDQDSGFLTRILGQQGFGNLRGRRGKLRRFIDEDAGWITIIDGPIGAPRMSDDYASFTFELRDSREVERKVELFRGGGGIAPVAPGEPFNPTGVKTLLPDSVWDGYGYDAGTDTYLIDPAAPVLGRVHIGQPPGGDSLPTMRSMNLQSTPGNPDSQIGVSRAAYQAGQGAVTLLDDWHDQGNGVLIRHYRVEFRYLTLLWRAQGSSDPWTELTGTLWINGYQEDDGSVVGFLYDNLFLSAGAIGDKVRVGTLIFGDSRGDAVLPAENADIECIVVYRGPPTKDLPTYVEGITAGELARNAYAGLYSARDPNGTVKPTGIRYDEAALLAMTDPVRIRLTEPIEDARDWLEKYIYAPTGWIPALDADGRISPVSQVPPTSPLGLVVINNPITEPSPDWNAGERVVNVLRFVYPRDYRPTSGTAENDGLLSREIVVEWTDEPSITRCGRQVLELKGDAFRAVGTSTADPLGGLTNEELGWQLSQLRQLHVQRRYSLGSPAITVPVMRHATSTLRAGSWVVVDLSWLPDYVTRRRGLLALGQVVSLGDLDCAWRQAMIEMVVPILPEGSGS